MTYISFSPKKCEESTRILHSTMTIVKQHVPSGSAISFDLGALAALAALVLARCDEVARFSEEAGKITRTFLSEPMRNRASRVPDRMTG